MLYRGNNVEVLVDVTDGTPFTVPDLKYYMRSDYLMIVRSGYRGSGPFKSLMNVDPKPLFDFPGHDKVPEQFFKELLLYDANANVDLVLVADALEHVTRAVENDSARYEAGEFVIKAGTKLYVGEAGLGWFSDPNDRFDMMLVAWSFIVDLRSTGLTA